MAKQTNILTQAAPEAAQAELFQEPCDTGLSRIELPDADLGYYRKLFSDPQSFYRQLCDEVAWRQDTITMYGKPVLIPRLNAWYGDSDAQYGYSGLAMDPLPWTPLLDSIRQPVQQLLNLHFNSVLVNHYRDGNDSVAWHSDDEPELGAEPIIASVSFGAVRRFQLRHRNNRQLPMQQIELASGSLLVMRGSTQRCWQHQVPKQRSVVDGRINLTFRQIVAGVEYSPAE